MMPYDSATKQLDGRALAARIYGQLRPDIVQVERMLGRPPGLGVVLVGDHGPSAIYVRNKARAAHKLGMVSRVVQLPGDVTQKELMAAIYSLNNDDAIDAFLLQLPLPPHLDGQAAIAAIAPHKDGDGLGPGTPAPHALAPKLLPCTPAGCMALIQEVCPKLSGLHGVVIGRSNIVGRPMAKLLLDADATVTICHSRTQELQQHTRMADILVVAAGVPQLIGQDHLKPGCVVIDVGIHRQEGPNDTPCLVGDVDTLAAAKVARAITPVPGGVGPMTIAMLMQNAVRAALWAATQQTTGIKR